MKIRFVSILLLHSVFPCFAIGPCWKDAAVLHESVFRTFENTLVTSVKAIRSWGLYPEDPIRATKILKASREHLEYETFKEAISRFEEHATAFSTRFPDKVREYTDVSRFHLAQMVLRRPSLTPEMLDVAAKLVAGGASEHYSHLVTQLNNQIDRLPETTQQEWRKAVGKAQPLSSKEEFAATIASLRELLVPPTSQKPVITKPMAVGFRCCEGFVLSEEWRASFENHAGRAGVRAVFETNTGGLGQSKEFDATASLMENDLLVVLPFHRDRARAQAVALRRQGKWSALVLSTDELFEDDINNQPPGKDDFGTYERLLEVLTLLAMRRGNLHFQ